MACSGSKQLTLLTSALADPGSGRLVHRRRGRRTPVPPAPVHGDQARRPRRAFYQVCPGMKGQPGGNGLPPALAGEQAAEQLRRAAPRSEDHLGRSRLVRPLPAEVTGDPQRRTGVGQGGVRGEAVEEDDVARLVAGRGPAERDTPGLDQVWPGRPGVAATAVSATE